MMRSVPARDLLRVNAGAPTGRASKIGLLVVHGVEAEAALKAVVPFEVVEKRPMKVSPHVGSTRARAIEGGEALPYEIGAHPVGGVGDAVLRDEERQSECGAFHERALHPLGIELPPEVAQASSRSRAPRLLTEQGHKPSRVVAHAEEIRGSAERIDTPAHRASAQD